MMNSEKKSDSSLAHIKSKIKVVFLGDQSTGKTSILLRFMLDKFDEGQAATVGIDFMAKNLTIRNFHLRLQLWDTAGQERFRSLIPSYLKDASVAFIVFDLTSRRSFESVREWIDLCNQNKKDKSVVALIGNKVDLKNDRQVSTEEAQSLAKTEGMPYFEVSAKDNLNIAEMFASTVEQYVRNAHGNEILGEPQKETHEISGTAKQAGNIELSNKPITGGPQSKKKAGECC